MIPKPYVVRVEPHLEFVRRYPGKITRRSDPHHLPSLLGARRRSCDLFVIPLTRERHNEMDTVEGKLWEKNNLVSLYQFAFRLMLEDEHTRERIGEEVCLSGMSADTTEKMARLCSLAIMRHESYGLVSED